MSPEQLRLAVRQQTVDVALNALPVDSGTYRFEPQPQGVADSVPDTEYLETVSKARAVLRAVAMARTARAEGSADRDTRESKGER